MKVTLTVHGQEKEGEKFEFTKPGNLLFGRSEKAQCCIVNDPYVSRMHFLLLINPPEVRLRNLSQTNGTEVDGVLYTQSMSENISEAQTLVKVNKPNDAVEAILRNGIDIVVGYTRITVTIDADKECHDCGRKILPGEEKFDCNGGKLLCPDCRQRYLEQEEDRKLTEKKKEHEAQHHRVQELYQRRVPAKRHPLYKAEEHHQAGSPAKLAFSPSDRPDEMIKNILCQLRVSELKGTIPNIPGYEGVHQLEAGGMGLILEAKRIKDGYKTAIKVVRPDRRSCRELADGLQSSQAAQQFGLYDARGVRGDVYSFGLGCASTSGIHDRKRG